MYYFNLKVLWHKRINPVPSTKGEEDRWPGNLYYYGTVLFPSYTALWNSISFAPLRTQARARTHWPASTVFILSLSTVFISIVVPRLYVARSCLQSIFFNCLVRLCFICNERSLISYNIPTSLSFSLFCSSLHKEEVRLAGNSIDICTNVYWKNCIYLMAVLCIVLDLKMYILLSECTRITLHKHRQSRAPAFTCIIQKYNKTKNKTTI